MQEQEEIIRHKGSNQGSQQQADNQPFAHIPNHVHKAIFGSGPHLLYKTSLHWLGICRKPAFAMSAFTVAVVMVMLMAMFVFVVRQVCLSYDFYASIALAFSQ